MHIKTLHNLPNIFNNFENYKTQIEQALKTFQWPGIAFLYYQY